MLDKNEPYSIVPHETLRQYSHIAGGGVQQHKGMISNKAKNFKCLRKQGVWSEFRIYQIHIATEMAFSTSVFLSSGQQEF